MRRFLPICIAVLSLSLTRWFLVEAAENSGSTLPVILNGVTSIFGEPSALLQVTPAGQPTANILLDVGQQSYGVKLLAVNVSAASVRIENGGQIQTLKICSAPALDAAPANTATSADAASIVHSPAETMPRGLDGQIVSNVPLPNNLTAGAVLTGGDAVNASSKSSTAAGSDKVSNASNADSAAANSTGSAGTDAPKTHVYYWWMADAQQIEQTRQATVQQVLAGELQPQPLTPLTPAGTSASLIADYSVYMEHGRGMVVSN